MKNLKILVYFSSEKICFHENDYTCCQNIWVKHTPLTVSNNPLVQIRLPFNCTPILPVFTSGNIVQNKEAKSTII